MGVKDKRITLFGPQPAWMVKNFKSGVSNKVSYDRNLEFTIYHEFRNVQMLSNLLERVGDMKHSKYQNTSVTSVIKT